MLKDVYEINELVNIMQDILLVLREINGSYVRKNQWRETAITVLIYFDGKAVGGFLRKTGSVARAESVVNQR